MLPKGVGVTKNRFNEILSIIGEAKNDKLKTSVYGKEFALDNTERLLEGMVNEKINGSEAKKKYKNFVDDADTILSSKFTKD